MQRFLRLKASPPTRQFLIHLGLGLLLGFLWYLALYSRFPLYVSHVNWIYNAGGDALQHQLGWEWFRQEPWRFPLGSIAGYGYPFGTSITFLDSIPLLAIPFKLLSPWLESNFQYFGLWELASVIGQFLMGLLILHEFTRSYWLKILGASLLVLSPAMIFRAFYHSSLSAHWILLAAVWFILLEYRGGLWRGAWVVLFAAATLIHAYFIPMLLPLWIIGEFFHYKKEHRRWLLLADGLAVAAVVLGIGYCLGFFNLSSDSMLIKGFGVYSWNLNGLINPFDFSSAFIKKMATGTGGQYEGFSYLGLGILMLIPAALYVFLEKELSRRRLKFMLPFALAALVYILFSLSNRAFLNDRLLWDIPLSDPVLRICTLFRTSGRFIWPVAYFLVLFSLVSTIRNLRFAAPVLAAVILVQLIDLQPLIGPKHLPDFAAYSSPLQSEFWQPAADANEHLIIIPAKKLTVEYEPLALYAVHNQLTLNLGYFARSDTQAFQTYAEQVWQDLLANQADDRSIYVLSDPEWAAYAKEHLSSQYYVCAMDGYSVVLSAQNRLALSKFDLSPYCSVPDPNK